MTFVSSEMLLWQFGLVAIYWSLPRRFQMRWVSAVTAVFLFVCSKYSLAALLVLSLICYYGGQKRPGLAVTVCVLALVAYRILSTGNPMQAVEFRSSDVQLVQGLVVIGFAYYILRATHYLIEQIKGGFERHDLAVFLNYMFFLPTLFIGPINRFEDFLRDHRRRRWDRDQFAYGVTRIIYGYTKIVVVAYYLVNEKFALWIGSLDSASPALLEYLDCWHYALNIYFQFSGFSDVAIGIGALLGFRINENFNYPFLRTNISDFWRSWHMSLTSWSRDYVYPSVAAATRSVYLAIFVSMIFIGLWHEFTLKYFFWGLYHGFGIMTHRLYQRVLVKTPALGAGWLDRGLRIFYWLLTLHFIIIGFALPKENSIMDAIESVRTILFWVYAETCGLILAFLGRGGRNAAMILSLR